MITPPLRDLLGYSVTDVSMLHLINLLKQDIAAGRQVQIVTLNPEMLAHQSYDTNFQRVLRRAEYLVADGSGVVLASRILGCPIHNRLPGVELAEEIFWEGTRRSWKIYCLGGSGKTLDQAVRRIRERFPGIRLAGWHHGYFSDDDLLVREINRTRADVLLVGLGSPRQEEWIARHRSRLIARVLVGVGGSFDVIGGSKRRAPALFRKFGVEWVWRVISEPRRLKRIIPSFCRFGWLVACERLTAHRRLP
ncbi:MAG TPA: WecB/TagA/CpsF family glycosyltransferase [Atribacteraceae bacterium]|nr:WecB/TagA/CpsF family glycosyltransferase [Atribacteraceae bacterium]